jgi:hypothetical protein
MIDNIQSMGGNARAKALSTEDRKAIAKKAANARWSSDLPQAEYEGEFDLGGKSIACAVLPNGKRIITQATFLRTLGRSRSPKAGTGILSTVDGLPFFLQANALKPFIDEDLSMSTTPIFYMGKDGQKQMGYDAELLPKVAEVYLKFRDSEFTKTKRIPGNYEHIIKACDILTRGLARIGIIALIDEATGYQRDRAKDALQKILEQFIAKELRPWVYTFPSEFYEHLFRLRELKFPTDTVKKPSYFGHLTNDIIYARLAPNVLDEIKKQTPRDDHGRHKHQLHRRLTTDLGHPKLRELLASVVTLMKISNSWTEFKKHLDKVHPKFNTTLELAL